MKETRVYMFDDLDFAARGERVEADETVRLMLGDELTELDLTPEHAKDLRELLAPYFAAGTPPGDGLRKPHRSSVIAGIPHADGQPPADRAERYKYNEGMRNYADARGIPYRNNADQTPYYPVTLRTAFAAYLRNGGRD